MDKLHIHACPLCGNREFSHLLTCKDYYVSGESFGVYICCQCGFRFTQDAPAEAEIGRYYETPQYISHTDTQKGLVNKLYHWVRKRMLSKKARLVARNAGLSHGRLLDIGTGTAYFPYHMKKRGWAVAAIEKNEKARRFAKEHFGLEVGEESLLDELPDSSFDAITLWHVMEHLEKLNETWERLRALLAERGVLVVAVPNSVSYDAGYYKEYWAAYDVPRHLWHFVPETMRRMGEKHGFELVNSRPMPFDAFYVSILSEKYRHSSAPFIKGMCRGFVALFHSLPKKGRSSSMIYVFRKKQL